MSLKGLAGLAAGIVILVGGVWGVDSCAHLNYSNGSRVGKINKFSSKGYLFKTYEGTLSLEGQQLKEWRFSVDAEGKNGKNLEQLAQDVQSALDSGKSVKLDYVQPFKKIWFWEGETEYSVVNVTPIIEQTPENK